MELISRGGGAGKARFNVATPTYEARTRPLHVQHTYYRIIFKQNPFTIISRGVQRCPWAQKLKGPGERKKRYIPMSLSRCQKIPKLNIGNHYPIFEI